MKALRTSVKMYTQKLGTWSAEPVKEDTASGVVFDFEGSMIKGVANHYKQFGSTPMTYYSVEKYYRWYFRIATLWNRIKERRM